jgi:hypothetical protein
VTALNCLLRRCCLLVLLRLQVLLELLGLLQLWLKRPASKAAVVHGVL